MSQRKRICQQKSQTFQNGNHSKDSCKLSFGEHLNSNHYILYFVALSLLVATSIGERFQKKFTQFHFMKIMTHVILGCRLIRRVSTDNLDGYHVSGNSENSASVNIQGEDQKKLDVIANRIFKNALCCSGKLQLVASEEEDEPCLCSDVVKNNAFAGEFAAVFDPLDGSSNIDSGLPTGTIFGVYKNPPFKTLDPLATVTQKGGEMVVAGYCLYSASTHIMITLRTGLHMFTLDDNSGEFFLTRSNVRIPRRGSVYSFNDANSNDWDRSIQYFLNDLKSNRLFSPPSAKKQSARYMGALVADAHNILLNGGIFGYPGTVAKPAGKLRLLYEANPLAVMMEEAGGMASNGRGRILDQQVKAIHQRTPLFLGSVDDVSMLEKYVSFYNSPSMQQLPLE